MFPVCFIVMDSVDFCPCFVLVLDFTGTNGRRESQGSLSSGASLELGTSGRNEVSLKGACDLITSLDTDVGEEASLKD